MGGMRKKRTTGAAEPEELQCESLCTDIKKRHKRYKSEWDTWGQSNTSPCVLTQPPSPSPSYLTILIQPLVTCFLFSAHLSFLSHNTSLRFLPYSFCLLFFSSFLLFALPHSLSPSAAVSRPRHPTLPSAADINQPLCGKQREGRREREGWKKREKASRQPVIRTNVDGLHIAGWEEQNSFASLFYI